MEIFMTTIYGLIVALAGFAAFSMEYYARKAKVSAAPSVPWMRRAVVARLKAEVAYSGLASPIILELGSGWGTLAFDAARAFPEARITGYEISVVPLMVSRMRACVWGYKNVEFYQTDFMKADFSGADIVLAYLNVPLMDMLRPKCEAEMKAGSVVISNTFAVTGWVASEEETIQNFIYTLKVLTYRMPVQVCIAE